MGEDRCVVGEDERKYHMPTSHLPLLNDLPPLGGIASICFSGIRWHLHRKRAACQGKA